MPEKKKQELKDRAPIVAAYLRVSTDKQTILNQKSEVINFCHRQELKITMWCTETVSGTKKESERELGILLKKLQKGDVLIITEVSRLSRKMMNIMNIIHQSIEKGITIHSIKEGYKFDSSINSQVLAFAFGLCAEIERTLISQRTREALARRRAQGIKLGRPKGSLRAGKLFEHEQEIKDLRTEGFSFQKIAMRYKVSPETVRLFYLRTLLKKPKKTPEEEIQEQNPIDAKSSGRFQIIGFIHTKFSLSLYPITPSLLPLCLCFHVIGKGLHSYFKTILTHLQVFFGLRK